MTDRSCSHTAPPGGPPGFCAACLIEVALEAPAPPVIQGYELLEEIGRGGMGTVYRAVQDGTGMLVALKVIHNGEPGNEIGHLVRLGKHPNIVQIHAGGLKHDPPYFAMELVEGGTLADERWRRVYSEPQRAAKLVAILADAVQYAHERLVLHRDLKPANILIDEAEQPHVGDFSVAKRVDSDVPHHPATIAGSLGYMAPEQAGAIDALVTTTSDVYGLGAILYELLTGRCPRSAATLPELVESFAKDPVVPPSPLAKGVSRELDAVCLRALSASPNDRYRSAAALAADLKRVVSGEPLPWLPATPREKVVRWVEQHRWVAASLVAGALLLAATNFTSFARVRAQEAELRDVVLRTNAALAKAQAQAVLAVVERYATEVSQVAAEPRIERFLERAADPDRVPDADLSLPGFDSVFVMGCDGFTRAHSVPDAVRAEIAPPPGYFTTDFSFRSYFRGARVLAQRHSTEAYMSPAFHSRWDRRFKFAFASAIYRRTTQAVSCEVGSDWIGILLASRNASSTLERVQIADLDGSGHFTALFGPRDRDSPAEPMPPPRALHVVVHDRLRLGAEQRTDPVLAGRLLDAFGPAAEPGEQFQPSDARPYHDDRYTDPLWPSDMRWLGGFYPVGRTGFVVGVQTPYGKATEPIGRAGELFLLNLGFLAYGAAALGLTLRKTHGPQLRR